MSQNEKQNQKPEETRSIARQLARELSHEELDAVGAGGVSCSCCRADDCCQN